MNGSFLQYLQNVLHVVSQALMYPILILLLVTIGYALFSIGSILVELARERRYFNVVIPRFLRAIKETPQDEIATMLATSGMLREQQKVLLTIYNNRDLDEESRWALAKKLLIIEKERRQRVVSRNDAMAKLAPMFGLMGTLIPLGPGIVAFGQGNAGLMAAAMLVAFDTTIAGLVAAAVLFVVARVRRRWYAEYSSSLEAAATTMLERIDKMTDAQRQVQTSMQAVQPSVQDARGAGR